MLVEDGNTQLIDGIRKAVADKGADYIYKAGVPKGEKRCVYFDLATKCPSCLIGHGLSNMGYTPDSEFVSTHGDTYCLVNFNSYGAAGLLQRMGFDSNVIMACTQGQSSQDKGDTWGEALEIIHESLIDQGVADKYWR
jgi:hypothetical protein